MSPIEPPDAFHLLATIGWLELGNPSEARAELDKVNPALTCHPDILEAHWQVCAAEKKWDAALEYAELLVKHAPKKETGWLHRAYALRRATNGGLENAWAALRPAYELFPKVALIPYNLACYAAQLGQLDEAWAWYQKAGQTGKAEAIRAMALDDSDLQPLWDRIRASKREPGT